MTKKLKKLLIRIIVSAALLIALIVVERLTNWPDWVMLVLFAFPYGIAGYDVLFKAARNIGKGQLLDENFLMSVATIGAIALGEYGEAVAVMLFYQIGEWFQSYAVGKSRRSIAELMDIAPEYANLIEGEGFAAVSPYQVKIGDLFLVKPGERVPIDGTVVSGRSSLNTASLTGESLPRDVAEGEPIYSGSINLTSPLTVRADKLYQDSTVARILDLVENTNANKGKTEQFITRFARVYTPIIVFSALALALLPPLLTATWSLGFPAALKAANWAPWVRRALIFLVVSCPCALVISVPLSFFGGIGKASSQGILIKGTGYLEQLTRSKVALFDKTGTLTEGSFSVKEIRTFGTSKEELLETAVLCEAYSNHPLAQSLRDAWGKPIHLNELSNYEEISGEGVTVLQGKDRLAAGNDKLMARYGITELPTPQEPGTVIFIAMNRRYLGYILVADNPKPEASSAIAEMKTLGIQKAVMLTGDHQNAADYYAAQLGVDEAYAELLPEDKVRLAEEYSEGSDSFFVGDGINDAPALAASSLGIAMGALGSDAAMEAADIVLMDDSLSKIPVAMKIAAKTKRIVIENIVVALGVKIAVLVLTALGVTDSMLLAIFADVGVAVLAILNALRALV